jgi:uncharacterized protein
MHQSWRDLLFAHWPVPCAELRGHVPPMLELEEHSGSSWVGLTPFLVAQLRARGLPAVPVLSRFAEVNLRTYVRVGDTPGIWFFSLDAASRLTVFGARRLYRLPYYLARMRMEKTEDEAIEYRSSRRSGAAELDVRYRPLGRAFSAGKRTLEHFLIERYVLFSVTTTGAVLRGDIHHGPWFVQNAEARFRKNTIALASGIHLPATKPLLHFAARQDTVIWPPKRVL